MRPARTVSTLGAGHRRSRLVDVREAIIERLHIIAGRETFLIDTEYPADGMDNRWLRPCIRDFHRARHGVVAASIEAPKPAATLIEMPPMTNLITIGV